MKNLRGWRRYKVERCDDGESLVNGPDHTWDVVDRTTGAIVHNADTRDAARLAAHNLESEAFFAKLKQGSQS